MTEDVKPTQNNQEPAVEAKPEEKPAETTPVAGATVAPEVTEAAPAVEVKTFDDLAPGMTVRVHQKIRETNTKGEEKERIQVYEGIIIAKKHGNEAGATITVRKIASGVGVEKIFALNSPAIAKIEAVKSAKVRHAKLYFLRTWKKKLKETLLK